MVGHDQNYGKRERKTKRKRRSGGRREREKEMERRRRRKRRRVRERLKDRSPVTQVVSFRAWALQASEKPRLYLLSSQGQLNIKVK